MSNLVTLDKTHVYQYFQLANRLMNLVEISFSDECLNLLLRTCIQIVDFVVSVTRKSYSDCVNEAFFMIQNLDCAKKFLAEYYRPNDC